KDGKVEVQFGNTGTPSETPAGEIVVTVPCFGRHVVKENSTSESNLENLAYCIGLVAFVAPYVIIAGLTRFHPGDSTIAQRAWTLAWLVCGQVFGFIMGLIIRVTDYNDKGDVSSFWIGAGPLVIAMGVPAIGGLVVVAQMILAFGS